MVCCAIIGAAEGQGNIQSEFEIVLNLANMIYCVKSYSLLLIGIGFREKDDQRIKKPLQSKNAELERVRAESPPRRRFF